MASDNRLEAANTLDPEQSASISMNGVHLAPRSPSNSATGSGSGSSSAAGSSRRVHPAKVGGTSLDMGWTTRTLPVVTRQGSIIEKDTSNGDDEQEDAHTARLMAQAHAVTSAASIAGLSKGEGVHSRTSSLLNGHWMDGPIASSSAYQRLSISRASSPTSSRPSSPKPPSPRGSNSVNIPFFEPQPVPTPPPLLPPNASSIPNGTLTSAQLATSPLFSLPRTPELTAFFSSLTPTINGRRFSAVLADTETLLQPMKASALFVAQLDPAIITFFLTSISFTIARKLLLRQPDGIFPFPFILLGAQAGFATLATHVARRTGTYRAARLTRRQDTMLRLLALLFSVEELTSTLSLRLVTVPFHLSVRALSPILTLALSVAFFDQRTSLRTASTFLLIVLGVVLTSLNLDIHSFGSFLAFTSTILLSVKSLITSHLLTERYGLGTLDLVSRIAPISIAHYAAFATVSGEFGKFVWVVPELTSTHFWAIMITGSLSVGVLFASLAAEQRVRAPAPAISAHASQAFTIIVSVIVFALPLSLVNFVGVALTLGGGVLYAWYEALDTPPVSTFAKGKGLPMNVGPSARGMRL